jgi:hypothetical protein
VGTAAPARRPGRGRQVLATVVMLALIVAAGVAIYLALTSGGNEVQLVNVEQDSAADTIDRMLELVESNTR